ncbi:uncharacterized protein METZ01_LOCUS405987 [marine metagenome]|uniref:Uncharacterized protein n=1 Tax=marine metagenome TaxID=408172 RepID=A0A382W304_9ZZZZ
MYLPFAIPGWFETSINKNPIFFNCVRALPTPSIILNCFCEFGESIIPSSE